jgi:TLD
MNSSKIIKKSADKFFLFQLMCDIGTNLKLLYRGSRDGWNVSDFHNKCDEKGATLTLFHTDKNIICGGYTAFSWKSADGKFEKDMAAFIFSLKTRKVYHPTGEVESVCSDVVRGPYFGRYRELSCVDTIMN